MPQRSGKNIGGARLERLTDLSLPWGPMGAKASGNIDMESSLS
jgi:hypothetical protein